MKIKRKKITFTVVGLTFGLVLIPLSEHLDKVKGVPDIIYELLTVILTPGIILFYATSISFCATNLVDRCDPIEYPANWLPWMIACQGIVFGLFFLLTYTVFANVRKTNST